MSEFKKYMDVTRLGHKSTQDVLKAGDYIVVEEKIDGANASFTKENNMIKAFSRNCEVNEENTFRGFFNYTQTLNIDLLNEDYIYFGEWCVKHKIQYPNDKYNQFYLFDIWSKSQQKYLPFDIVKDEAKRISLNLIPVFYIGVYESFEKLQQYIGKTLLGGEKGEGIVVKNINYFDCHGKQLFVKLVSEEFAEIQKQKLPKDTTRIKSIEDEFVETNVTKARIDKMLNKLVDEDILDVDFGLEDMRIILSNLGTRIYDDVIKEESDYLPEQWEEKLLKKAIGTKIPKIVKEIINEKTFLNT